MRRLINLLLLCCIAILTCHAGDVLQKPGKPIRTLEDCLPVADPYVMLYKGQYYAYGTHVKGFEVYISRDLKTWRRGDKLALSPEDSWGDKWYWAPEVYCINNLFYMFYTVNEQVCVAISGSPEGPFVQDEKKPLFGSEKNIDPSLFIDNDGTPYLYFVRFTDGNVIWGAEMNPDLKSIKTETLKQCIVAEAEWERRQDKVAEGPSILKKNGIYYLLYSANHFQSQDYAVGYATSASPLGPWAKYNENPILRRDIESSAGLVGTGHGAPFMGKDGKFRYIYHAHASTAKVNPRTSYIKNLTFSKDGIISIYGKVIKPIVR